MIFLRAPASGRVKTRLSADIPAADVVRLYRAMVADVLAAARASGIPLDIWVEPAGAASQIAQWLGRDLRIRSQPDGNIGMRMAAGFKQAWQDGICRAVLIGTDIPGITAEDLTQALSLLADHPVVMGPTLDGGYGLIGLRPDTENVDLFGEIDWGTNRVMAQTEMRLRTAGLSCGRVGPLLDLDTYSDILAFAADSRHKKTRTAQRFIALNRRPST